MAAIVSSHFRKLTSDKISDISNNFYIGFGKTDPWETGDNNPPNPTTSYLDLFDAKNNLIGLKKVNYITRVIPKVILSLGKRYKAWDSSDSTCYYPSGNILPCYALDPLTFNLFMCVQNGIGIVSDVSFVEEPDNISSSNPNRPYGIYSGTDGYKWAFLGKVNENSSFNSTQFLEIPSEPSNSEKVKAKNATGGKLLYVKGSGGINYNNGIFQVLGDGSGASVQLNSQNGALISASVINSGSDYSYGNITGNSSGYSTNLKFIFAPKNGFGSNLIEDLPSWFLGLGVDISGSSDLDIPTLRYRQLSVIDMSNETIIEDSQNGISTLKRLTVNGVFSNITIGSILIGSNGARAFVDNFIIDSGNTHIYYHQNSSNLVNFLPFQIGNSVSINIGNVNNFLGNIINIKNPEYNKQGNVIFLENFKPKTRNLGQIEEVRIVIQM